MNRILSATAVAILSSIAFAGVGHAESFDMNTAPAIENTLRSFDNGNFNVRYAANWGENPDTNTRGLSVPGRSEMEVQAIQASIEANKALVNRLDHAGVSVHTIVNAEQAADGGVTFYVH